MATSPAQDSASGLLRVAGAGIIWGTIPIALRAAEGSPTVTVFYRMLLAGTALTLYMVATKRLGDLRLSWSQYRALLIQGAILTVNWLLFFGALTRTNVATAELLAYTGPVFVAALAPFVSKEPFEARILAPMALALAGIAIILAPQGLAVGSREQLIGAAMAFGSALTYAALLLRSKRILRSIPQLPLMVVEYVIATVVLLPAALLLPGPSTPRGFAAIAYLGLVTTALTGVVFLSGLKRVRTDHAAVLMYAEPVSAVLFAAALLGERLTWPTIVGGLMVVLAGVIVTRLRPSGGIEEPAVLDEAGNG